ncbi:MarR family transcriptional regulator [Paenibacillus piri]|uniref:MarR family transcriptional regulator n=1 Tax=Paenibacillus piri TaxID=2547395 RepID=A0A4R5KI68_9BACL|nr:MarR family transcriptional regulator [Paenibacillus piri]TDF94772.1 MarR family transcriptional regulator [Paenibacillus piri]
MTTDESLSWIFNKVSDRHSIIKNIAEKDFMSEHTFLEVHCIDFIEKLNDPNVTKLAKAFRITRGAVSKVTKKLQQSGKIEAYQKPGNKKEIYYKLTDAGRVVFEAHESMHRSRIDRDSIIFRRLNDEEKSRLVDILKKVNAQLEIELSGLGMENY